METHLEAFGRIVICIAIVYFGGHFLLANI